MLETAWESRWLPDYLKKEKEHVKDFGRRRTVMLKSEETMPWGRSSAGRAPALQAGGQEFESLRLHSDRNACLLHLENFIQKEN